MASVSTHNSQKDMEFGLIFFASSEAPSSGGTGGDSYRLVIDSARFADRHGFSSVWIPERHFTRDGWLYPNPAVLQAALARETQRIHLRAGSVVMPLHNPLRVAEEWAIVDNLSCGRVGLSFASGWHPNDFALFPEHYADRNEEMYRGIQMVHKLWRGEAVQVKGGDGNLVEIRTYPMPIQPTLPTWITAAGNPKTFMRAGEIGANLLTHLYNHTIEELAERIQLYRESRARHGHDPQTGQVSVMLHTFVWEKAGAVIERAKAIFCEYLKSAAYLVNAIAYSRGQKIDLAGLSEQDSGDYLNFVFDRLISAQRVLFGTPESCLEVVSRLKAIGVTEIACQMDFGLEPDLALQSLQYVDQLKELSRTCAPASLSSALSLAPRYGNVAREAAHSNGAFPLQGSSGAVRAQQPERIRDIQERCRDEVAPAQFYSRLQSFGIQLAGSFQGIERLSRRDGEALGWINLPQALEQEIDVYQIHPALLDACLQVLVATLPAISSTADEGVLYMPTGLRSFRIIQRPAKSVWSHAQLRLDSQQEVYIFEGDVHLLDEEGQVLVETLGLRLQRSELAIPSSAHITSPDDQLYYEIRWEPGVLEQAAPLIHAQAGTWLIFMDSGGVGQHLADLLSACGDTCIKVLHGYTYQVLQQGVQYSINPANAEHIQRVIDNVLPSALAATAFSRYGVIHLWSLDMQSSEETSGATLETEQALGVGSALNLLQSLVNNQSGSQPRLWFVTRGTQPVGTDTFPLAVTQSPLWGFGRTCAIEHPELWGGLVDADPLEEVHTTAAQLLAVLSHQHAENQLAFRQGRSYVARLVRRGNWPQQDLRLRSDASYLITGGLWGLGFEVARWMASKGARHLVLLGRTRLPPRTAWDSLRAESRQARQVAGIRELERAGIRVHYASVDVADERQLTAFLQNFRAQFHPPISGVVHAASVWQDQHGKSLVRPLMQLDQEAVKAVFRPKVLGSWHLHKLFQDTQLDFFVLFSSGASLFGSAAQGNYAAAGTFLDALAQRLRSAGRAALSIDWGAVSGTGFGETREGLRVHEYWESHGIQRIAPQQVLAALELLIPQHVAQVGVLKLDWQQLQQFYPQLTNLPLFTYLASEVVATAKSPLFQRLSVEPVESVADQEKRQQILEAYLSEKVAGVLRLPASAIDTECSLTMQGLDSLMAIELKNRIELELHVHIPIVTFLQGPSIRQFATQLLSQLTEVAAVPALAAQTMPEQSQTSPANKPAGEPDQGNVLQVLAQLDQLSEAEVDALLGSVLQQGNGHVQAIHGLNPQEASQVLANIKQLSDSEVDSLLKHMLIVQEERLNQ